jgi:cell division protein FtsI/penicillin-binding protein 2
MASRFTRKTAAPDWRIRMLKALTIVATGVVCFRLFSLQVVNAGFYGALASNQHTLYEELFASRGNIYIKDWADGKEYLAATNQPTAFLYADPRRVEDPIETAIAVGRALGYSLPEPETIEEIVGEEAAAEGEERAADSILDGVISAEEEPELIPVELLPICPEDQLNAEGGCNSDLAAETDDDEVPEEVEEEKGEEILALIERFSKTDDPYEPIARYITEYTLNKILDLELPGIYYFLEDGRSYPETNVGGHVFGFVGKDAEDNPTGLYGIEGYFDDVLGGEDGFLDMQADTAGRWIGVSSRQFKESQDGDDILLTIDRTIQYAVCDILKRGVETHQADGGSVVVLEPKTGKVMAMCSVPDFDPNNYGEVEGIATYNNKAIFDAYEPGSVFKPLVMAAALDQGVVTPSSTYNDLGEVLIPGHPTPIRNSDRSANGIVTMVEVLENSLNTGMVHVMQLLTGRKMTEYIEAYGFGTRMGIELDSESAGTLDSLDNDHDIYYATASFGQGITTTLLQIASAYATLANGGMMMQPYIVEEIRSEGGVIKKVESKELGQIVSRKTAIDIGAMIVSVIENGHAEEAAVPGYYIGGKTGTAQVADEITGGYSVNNTNATFAGFGPVEDPTYVAAVVLYHPQRSPWASDTAAPIFADISEFILRYLEVAPRRVIE